MSAYRWMVWPAVVGVGVVWAASGCGKGDDDREGRPELTGSECETVDDCYPDLDHEELAGEVLCLDRVRDGYCTHLCAEDEDCCALEGECATDLLQVCSPFEATGLQMCFLSCEEADLRPAEGADPADPVDDQEFCQRAASKDFVCRSSGGGSLNRKICVPGVCGVGSACASTEDCDADLECLTGYRGGYCTQTGCTANADCPMGSACAVVDGGPNQCLRICTKESDCSLCRDPDVATACTADVPVVDDMTASLCVPAT
jgi:hypothetical protein